MYISCIKKDTKALVQNNHMDFEIFDNTNNLNLLLKTKNNIEILNKKKQELELLDDTDKKEVIMYYLNLKEEKEKRKLNKYLDKHYVIYTKKKVFEYIDNNDFIKKLYSELKQINTYLEIRDCLINHKELNIQFTKKGNQRKKLKFLNLCFSNVNEPELFINTILNNDKANKTNKIKKLKY